MYRTLVGFCTWVALICALAAGSHSAQRGPRGKQALLPSLTAGRAQYSPGTLAVFSGSGFLPHESVQMVVTFASGAPLGSDHDFWNAVADVSGRFTTSWLVSEDQGVRSMLWASAYGASSGTYAGTSFLNANDCGTGVVSSVTPVGAYCSDFTPAQGSGPDNYEVAEGGTYVMTITGVTECSGDTITVFVQSSNNGNFCFNATGGSGTYSGTFTLPNPACNTMPVSYKCGANAPCNNSGSLDARGPTSECGGVHLRASTFDGNCDATESDQDCNGPADTGACCLADGSCVQVTADECANQGGTYSGDGSSCANANCPQPTGACCLADGSCVEVTEEECGTQGGTYNGDGSSCGSANCPQPTGACCLTDGSCVEDVTSSECFELGGQYNGAGSTCGSVICEFPAGACCLADGSCVQVTATECGNLGGSYQGDGSTCKDADCPQPTGACCLVDGSCLEETEEDCATLGGAYNGDGSTCAGVVCEEPFGACCLADGSCVELTVEDCVAAGGSYYGDWTTCGSTSCPQPTGACCLTDDECVDVTEEACSELGGVYFGDGSECSSLECDPAFPDCFVLGFDTDDDGNAMPHGAMVDAEYDCNGSVYPITITGSVNPTTQNTAAILNSTTGPAMTDPDLLVSKGNILILQYTGNLNQCPANSGVYCSHNDNPTGGTLSFAFCVPASPSSITLIDQDLTDATGSSVVLTDVNSKTRTYTIPSNWTGDRVEDFPELGWKVLNLTTLANQPGFAAPATASEQAGFDPNAVVTLTVTFSGSGGIDDLVWCQ